MNTWISKAFTATLLSVCVSGCDSALTTDGLAFLQPGDGGLFGKTGLADEVFLAGGAIRIKAPEGFCVDQNSKTRDFVLLAHCTKLGVPDAQPVFRQAAVITASTFPARGDVGLSAEDLKRNGEKVLDQSKSEASVLLRVSGTPPQSDFNTDYWRSASRLGAYVVGFSVYSDVDAPPLGPYGKTLIEQSLKSTSIEETAAFNEPE